MGFTAFLITRNYLFILTLSVYFLLKSEGVDRVLLVVNKFIILEDLFPVCKQSSVC